MPKTIIKKKIIQAFATENNLYAVTEDGSLYFQNLNGNIELQRNGKTLKGWIPVSDIEEIIED